MTDLQSFETVSDPSKGEARLKKLRQVMRELGLDAYIVPRTDRFQGEYIAPADECLAWLTGFTGSAGFCVVTHDEAAVFVDSRYRVQVKSQVAACFTPVDWPEQRLEPYLLQRLPRPARIAYDPWLHHCAEVEKWQSLFAPERLALVEVDNLIHTIWPDRPAAPKGPIITYPDTYAGLSSVQKRRTIAEALVNEALDALFVPTCDSVAWLFNLRGSDIPRVPVFQSYAMVYKDGHADLIVDPSKLEKVTLPPKTNVIALDDLDQHLRKMTGTIRLNPASTPKQVEILLRKAGASIDFGTDYIELTKATKTPAELKATKETHDVDACAMIEFLAWLDRSDPNELSEIDVVRTLEGYRHATGKLRDISFDTIAGSGPNAAIVHYRVTHETNRKLRKGEFLLVDSGGQYLEGTTDITRTIALGSVSEQMQELYTRVLQGMIRISQLSFPKGTTGRDIDALARASLWAINCDYGHGTGHGVGAYLSVHEGPQRISKQAAIALTPGMILSNEPGFYLDGKFGIRIENLILVAAKERTATNAAPFYNFDTLTYVPIDTKPITKGILSRAERLWLNEYHQTCWDKYHKKVSDKARAWLQTATKAI